MPQEFIKKNLLNDPALVAYWRFEDDSLDYTNNYDLTQTADVLFGTGRFGRACRFYNYTDSGTISLTNNSNLGITGGNCTFGFWVNVNYAPYTPPLYIYQASVTNFTAYRITITSAATDSTTFKVERIKSGVATNTATQYSSQVTSGGVWFNVIATYDGTNLHIYINGTSHSFIASSGYGTSGIASDEFSVSLLKAGFPEQFLIDDFFVLSRALSETEVDIYYNENIIGQHTPGGARAYWRLNDNANPMVFTKDYSGNNLTGTCVGGLTGSFAGGKYHSGAVFDGVNSRILIGDVAPLKITDYLTFSAWVKPSTALVSKIIASKHRTAVFATTESYRFVINTDPSVLANNSAGVYFSQTGTTECGSPLVPFLQVTPNNVYFHIVATLSAPTSTCKVYINGVLQGTTIASGGLTAIKDSTADFLIGCRYSYLSGVTTYKDLFSGSLDEVIVENRIWSDGEVKRYYSNSVGKLTQQIT